jgi:hypothetical protein
MREKNELSPYGGDSTSKKYKQGYDGTYGESGGVCVWKESGVRRSLYVGAFGRNMASELQLR